MDSWHIAVNPGRIRLDSWRRWLVFDCVRQRGWSLFFMDLEWRMSVGVIYLCPVTLQDACSTCRCSDSPPSVPCLHVWESGWAGFTPPDVSKCTPFPSAPTRACHVRVVGRDFAGPVGARLRQSRLDGDRRRPAMSGISVRAETTSGAELSWAERLSSLPSAPPPPHRSSLFAFLFSFFPPFSFFFSCILADMIEIIIPQSSGETQGLGAVVEWSRQREEGKGGKKNQPNYSVDFGFGAHSTFDDTPEPWEWKWVIFILLSHPILCLSICALEWPGLLSLLLLPIMNPNLPAQCSYFSFLPECEKAIKSSDTLAHIKSHSTKWFSPLILSLVKA